jgi:hypothetical protein
MGILGFVTSDATRTISLTYNGEDRNTHVNTPLANLHNDLAGLQGGSATEYFHSTSAEYTGTGTGVFVRATSPALVTPDLGTPSALVGTNITGTASGLTSGTVTTNANLTGEATSIGNAATLTNSAVIGKVLTGYVSGAGTVAATDSILQAIQKLNGNTAAVPGTVTSVSVVSNNGFAGTVATATSTPAITLTTTVTGILKGGSGVISAGTSGTDYSLGTSALATGILKSTTTTGGLTIAVAGDFPTLNQDTTGTAAKTNALNSATTVVNVSSSAAPTNGQILTATGGTAATWQTPSGGGATLSNDTTTATQLYPMFAAATSGVPTTVYTSDAKLLYKPSTGELAVTAPIAANGLLIHATTVTSSYTVAAGFNSLSVGPITVGGGAVVTIAAGQRWLVL